MYLNNNIIPVGLQIKLSPQVGNTQVDFHTKWNHILQETSIKLIYTLIEEHDRQCLSFKQHIYSKESVLSSALTSDQLQETTKWLKSQTRSLRDDLIATKQQVSTRYGFPQ